jgi:phage terminase large subunit
VLRLTNVFHKNAEAYLSGEYDYIINQGGTSASKTFSILQLLTQIARKNNKQIDIVGLTVPHLRAGVINDMPKVLEGFNEDFHSLYKSVEKQIIYPSGGVQNFISVDKLGKAHGGRRDILYINEANHHNWNIAEQLMIRTRGVTFIDYNPTNEFWVHEHILSNPETRDRAILIKSTYKDNQFLEESIVRAIEAKRGDGTNNFWRVYGLGELGVAEGLVFDNWEADEFDIYKFASYRNGVDWGFSNDPFAFVRCAIENDTLYICEEIYQRGLLNKDSAEMIRPIVRNEVVRCDSAEPKSVAEYRTLGLNAVSTKKGKGSIESGIKKIQSFRNVVIHKTKCPNILAEFKNYQWRQDKNGEQLPEPVSGFDHGIDALRYALEDEMRYQPSNPISKPYTRYNTPSEGGWMS